MDRPTPNRFDDRIEHVISTRARTAGYFTKSDFLEINRWKTPRTAKRVAENGEEYVKTVTQTALSTPSERLRIEILTLLRGMGWRTSSVILHFAHKEPYPILDVRALWSLGIEVGEDKYNFDLWQTYTTFCRDLALRTNKTMRELDRAVAVLEGKSKVTWAQTKGKDGVFCFVAPCLDNKWAAL